MKQSGTARRIIRDPDKTYYIWIPVYYSEEAHRYHRVLPDFVIPFKQYVSNVIRAYSLNSSSRRYTIYEINMQSKQSITIQNISIAKLSTDIIANAANSGS